jgi:hypothetical protein
MSTENLLVITSELYNYHNYTTYDLVNKNLRMDVTYNSANSINNYFCI